MLFEDITLLDESLGTMAHAYVGTRGTQIDYVGTAKPEVDYGESFDGRGKVLMPGLVNAHAHVPMTLLRGYAENLPLDRWLNEKIFPFEAHITDEAAYFATMLGIAEMLRFGITSFSDMYYNSDARAKAVIESGIKCNLCNSVLDFADTPYLRSDWSSIDRHLIDTYHNAADGRLLIDMSLHAEYTNTETMVRSFAQAAAEEQLNVHTHLAETAKEVQECKERHDGMTPAAFFAECGVFDRPTTAAHCVWLEGDDFRILAEKGVTIATCPASNAKLGSGIMRERKVQAAGINLAIGTDGVASNNNHNMFKDLYLTALMSRADRTDPVGITPAQIIAAATVNGARSQGRFDTGVIKQGNRADLIVLDVDTPWMTPCDDLATGIVYSAQGSDVVLTMVDGAVLYRDGEYPTIDVERAKEETLRNRSAIIAEVARAAQC